MKKLTETSVLQALTKEHEAGYISSKTFCRLLSELGIARRYIHENYSNQIQEDKLEEVESAEQDYQASATYLPDELDEFLNS